MKKQIAIILALSFILCFAGCSNKTTTEPTTKNTTIKESTTIPKTTTTTTEETTEIETTTEEPTEPPQTKAEATKATEGTTIVETKTTTETTKNYVEDAAEVEALAKSTVKWANNYIASKGITVDYNLIGNGGESITNLVNKDMSRNGNLQSQVQESIDFLIERGMTSIVATCFKEETGSWIIDYYYQ